MRIGILFFVEIERKLEIENNFEIWWREGVIFGGER